MSKLQPCLNCGGLLPRTRLQGCPHCDAALPTPPALLTLPQSVAAGKQALGWGLAPRLTQLALGGSLAMTLMACYGAPHSYYEEPAHPDPQQDWDGDGFTAADDCNDRDAKVSPAAVDADGDGVDSDCDGHDGPKRQFAEPPGNQEPLQIAEPPADSQGPE